MAQSDHQDRVTRRRFLKGVFRGALTCSYVAAFGVPGARELTEIEPAVYPWKQVTGPPIVLTGAPDMIEIHPRMHALLMQRIRQGEADMHAQLAHKVFS